MNKYGFRVNADWYSICFKEQDESKTTKIHVETSPVGQWCE